MWSTNFITLGVLFIAIIDPSIAQKTAAADEVVVAEGAPLTVECALRVEQRAEWRVDGAAPPPDMRAAGERAAAGQLRARLHAPRAAPRHAGVYTCGAHSPPVRVRVLPAPPAPSPAAGEATTAAPTASGAEAGGAGGAAGGEARGPDDDLLRTLVTYKLFEPLTFNCTNRAATDAATRYEWYRNGTLFEAGGAKGWPTLEAGGAVLAIRRAHEDDWGNYTCRVGRAVAGAWQAEALNLPRVPPNTNVVEGQKFSITCKLIGKPYQPVTWWYRPSADANLTQLLAQEGGRVQTRDSAAGVPGGVLELADAAREDAGEYLCRAGGPGDAAAREDVSTVRVKDVYAALWPFLGICLEVFVLCAIILVYEKRRTKPELDDSDADTHDQ